MHPRGSFATYSIIAILAVTIAFSQQPNLPRSQVDFAGGLSVPRPSGNPTLSVDYASLIGGGQWDIIAAVASDAAGSIYLAGSTVYDAIAPLNATPGAYDNRSLDSWYFDVFVCKLDANMQLVYIAVIGGSYQDRAVDIDVDENGSAYVFGMTESFDFPVTSGAYQTVYGGSGDAFVLKLNPDGSTLNYSTFLGGSNNDMQYTENYVYWTGGLKLNSSGCPYVCGTTASTDFPTTPGALNTTKDGSTDVFISAISSDGSALSYSTFIGGAYEDGALDIDVGPSDDIFVVGRTTSSGNSPPDWIFDFPTTPGAYIERKVTGLSPYLPAGFALKISSDLSTISYSTLLCDDYYSYSAVTAYAVSTTVDGSAYVAGRTSGYRFPRPESTVGAYQPVLAQSGYPDGFVVKFNPAGSNVSCGTFLGAAEGSDCILSVAEDGYGTIYLGGIAERAGLFPVTSDFNASLASPNGNSWNNGLFVTRLTSDCKYLVSSAVIASDTGIRPTGVKIIGGGKVVATGSLETSSTFWTSNVVTPDALNRTLSGSMDGYVVKLGFNSNVGITSPMDISFQEGQLGGDVRWTVNRAVNESGAYEVRVNGTLYKSGTWHRGERISAITRTLNVSVHNFVINVSDSLGGYVTDSVQVTVMASASPAPTPEEQISLLLILLAIIAAAAVVASLLVYYYFGKKRRGVSTVYTFRRSGAASKGTAAKGGTAGESGTSDVLGF